MHSVDTLVNLRDVHLKFGEVSVLNGIDLSVRKGETISIIGPSGSGKSTILRCLNGLLRPHKGSVVVSGTDICLINEPHKIRSLREKVGFVFQQYNLFPHLSVLENLTLAPQKVLKMSKSDAQHQALSLLDKVRLKEKAYAFPGELSGGQQQRVAIARALAMKPELMLFDEVTSALDPEMSIEVLKVIKALAHEGMTCILVTHEMDFARDISDQIYFTENGVIVEHGSAEQIFNNPKHERTKRFLNHRLIQPVTSQSLYA